MLLFSCLLLLALLSCFCFYKKDGKIIPILLIGFLSAILVCSFKTLFLFAHRVIPYSFEDNFLYLLVRQILLPVIILYGLFFAVSKDDIEFKINAFFPLELSFYSVFLPHVIISSAEGLYSGFSLFVKPLLFAALLVQLSILVNWIFSSLKKNKIVLVVLFSLCALVYMFVPALFETMMMIKVNIILVILGSLFYCLIPVLLITFTAIKKINF